MGQVALGLRNVAIKIAVFVVMAALLAWALGGTLFPRPHVARLVGVEFGDARWYWQVSVSGPREARVWWELMQVRGAAEPEVVDLGDQWLDIAGPIVADDFLWIGGCQVRTNDWMIVRMNADLTVETYAMPDRLAVEQQLARLQADLPLQDAVTIEAQRPQVLDPPGE